MASNGDDTVPRPDSAAVELAYGIAITAYGTAQQRRDSVHQRIEVLLSFVATVTAAALFAAEVVLDAPHFTSPLLIVAGSLFVVVLTVGLVARVVGSLQQVSPQELYDRWLHYGDLEFRRRIIYWSGQHNDRARKVTYRKERAADAMTLLFLVAGILFLVWLAATN